MQSDSSPVRLDTVTISPGVSFKAAMVLAIIADALQIVVSPLFVEGALSPTDDILDFGIAAVLVNPRSGHRRFLPSFLARWVSASLTKPLQIVVSDWS
jgi:hypothetical protein